MIYLVIYLGASPPQRPQSSMFPVCGHQIGGQDQIGRLGVAPCFGAAPFADFVRVHGGRCGEGWLVPPGPPLPSDSQPISFLSPLGPGETARRVMQQGPRRHRVQFLAPP